MPPKGKKKATDDDIAIVPGSLVIVPYGQIHWPAVITSVGGSGGKAKAVYYHLPIYQGDYKFHCSLSKVKLMHAEFEKPSIVGRYANDFEVVWPQALDMVSWALEKRLDLIENCPPRPVPEAAPKKKQKEPAKKNADKTEGPDSEDDDEGELVDATEGGADLLEDLVMGQELPLPSENYHAGSNKEKRVLAVSETIFRDAPLEESSVLPETVVLINNPFGNGLWPAIFKGENKQAHTFCYQPFPRQIKDGRDRKNIGEVNTVENKAYKLDPTLLRASWVYAMKKDPLLYEALCDVKNFLIDEGVWKDIDQIEHKFKEVTIRPVYVKAFEHFDKAKLMANKPPITVADGSGDAPQTEKNTKTDEMFETEAESEPETVVQQPAEEVPPEETKKGSKASKKGAKAAPANQPPPAEVNTEVNSPDDDDDRRVNRLRQTYVIRDDGNKVIDVALAEESILRRPPPVAAVEAHFLREMFAARPERIDDYSFRFQHKIHLPIVEIQADELTSPQVFEYFENMLKSTFPAHRRFIENLECKRKWFPSLFGWQVPLAGFLSIGTVATVVDAFLPIAEKALTSVNLEGKKQDLGKSTAFSIYYATHVLLEEAVIYILTMKFNLERVVIEGLLNDASAYVTGLEKGVNLPEYLERVKHVVPKTFWAENSLLEEQPLLNRMWNSEQNTAETVENVPQPENSHPVDASESNNGQVVMEVDGTVETAVAETAKPQTESQLQNSVFPDVDMPLSPPKKTPPKASPPKRAEQTESRIPVKRLRRK